MTEIIENILILLQFAPVRRVFIVGPLVAVISALLGVGLVTGRRAMLGDGLSHVSFCAAAIALAIGVAPTALSIPAVIIAAILLLRTEKSAKSDASVALIAGGALAVGTFILSTVQGMNMNVSDYMFGSILTLSASDAVVSVICSLVVLAAFILFYRPMFAVSFDDPFASSLGIGPKKYNAVTAALTAVTVVVGMKIMGVMLVTALIVFPVLSAVGLCKSYRATLIFAAVSSVCCFTLGAVISLVLSLPTGATVVITYLILLAVCRFMEYIKEGSLKLSERRRSAVK